MYCNCGAKIKDIIINEHTGQEEHLCEQCLSDVYMMDDAQYEEDFLVYIGDCDDLEGL